MGDGADICGDVSSDMFGSSDISGNIHKGIKQVTQSAPVEDKYPEKSESRLSMYDIALINLVRLHHNLFRCLVDVTINI